jgi:hypothetical protein
VSLLDPNWLTDAVYTIVDRSRTVDQNGEFQRRQLAEWLDPRRYPPERHEFILDMMQDPDIGLCFRLPATREERYIVPEALPANRPYLGARPDNVLRFRFGYSYLPPGLIPRLIVESNRNLLPEMPRWRGGVMLATRDCEVLVLADADQRRVELEVSGPPALRRSALNVVLNDLDAVHALNPEAEPLALVPLPDQSDQQVRYEHLLELERRYGAEHSFLPEGSRREYTVRELLEGVRRDPGTALPRPSVARGCVVESQTHTVILVHGIRTTALWQSSVRAALEQQGFSVALTNYGRFDLFRFLCPGQFFRRRVVEEIARQLRHATRDAGGKCSVVAHSFGTFIIACILRDHTDIEFSRIIFCGSVVRHWFRFEDYRGRFEAPVINEVGTKDVLPVLAATTTTGYGSAGTFGFRRPGGVRDRWHNGVDHSAFLKPKFCRDFWVPYLRDGTIVEGDVEPQSPPWWIQIVAVAQPRWLVVMAGAAGLWWRFSPLLPAAW